MSTLDHLQTLAPGATITIRAEVCITRPDGDCLHFEAGTPEQAIAAAEHWLINHGTNRPRLRLVASNGCRQ